MRSEARVKAYLVGDRLIVWDHRSGSELYRKGFYGRPVSVGKPRSMDIDSPLILDLVEGLYLLEEGEVEVYDQYTGRYVSVDELRSHARCRIEDFDLKYMVYRDLRRRGYIVATGIKFGSDFAIYRYGPGIDHAPYLVQVKRGDHAIDPTDIVRAGRLATAVRKSFIVAIPRIDEGKISYLLFRWFKV
ncbi:MAG: tRNA-intron lyase [Nitrososphaerota archaeon]|nr:tRNA-intron lyase [Candidatus Bathyarchaeota archaeon]MCX8161739.1 tRNA-intron lyase [Candidatus Bathyarchaeota archaeon]MDW8061672.1 tRNA-intron lyase [Nitrososphaerota archaeon]